MSRTVRRQAAMAAGGCLLVFAVLAALVAGHWHVLQSLDTRLGSGPESLTYGHPWLKGVWLGVQATFTTAPMLVYTAIAAAVLLWRRQRRTALWVAVVMVLTPLVNSTLKALVGRHRPVWKNPVTVLADPSFPSGHSAAIACAAVVMVTLAGLYAGAQVRQVVRWVAVLLVLLVGADRVFLGVHNPSDVLAGWLLGAAIALAGLAVVAPSRSSASPGPLSSLGGSGSRHIAVVFNPIKIEDGPTFRGIVEHAAREAGWEQVEWHATTAEDPGASMAHAAAVGGAALVLACGGDGTVRVVSEELAGTGIPVGLLPAGTGNLLARNLDLPLNLRSALEVALHGQDRAVDLVKVSGDGLEESAFLVMAGMGFDAAIMEGVNESFKARFGWLAYVISAFRSLMYPAVRVDISVDGAPFTRHRARTIVLGNVGYLQAGMPLIPDAAIDDGELDVVLLYPRRFLSWIPLAFRVLSKSPRTDETITRMRGRTVTVRAHHETPRQLDGDLIAPGRELTAECLPGRLLLRAPR